MGTAFGLRFSLKAALLNANGVITRKAKPVNRKWYFPKKNALDAEGVIGAAYMAHGK